MEADREQANLVPEITTELGADAAPSPRQPKRRFIGRRAAAERAAAKGDTGAGIEDSGAIQGAASFEPSDDAIMN